MQTGETVFVLFVSDRSDKVWVNEHLVLDGDNKIVKESRSGRVRVLADWESIHATEADAWQRAAQELLATAANLRIKAEDCLAKAAAAAIVKVPA